MRTPDLKAKEQYRAELEAAIKAARENGGIKASSRKIEHKSMPTRSGMAGCMGG